MQVTFKLYPNQMFDLGYALKTLEMKVIRQTATTYVSDVVNRDGKKTGLMIDSKQSLLAFDGERKDFQAVLGLFTLMPTPINKMFVSHYDADGQPWLKAWETNDKHVEGKAPARQVIYALRNACDSKQPEKALAVNTLQISERLNVTKLVKLVKAEDWTKIQASYGKDEVELAKAIALYDKHHTLQGGFSGAQKAAPVQQAEAVAA